MLYLLLGHALQVAGVVYMCCLGSSTPKQQAINSSRRPLIIAGAVVFGLVGACIFCRAIIPFVLTTLVIWLAALPLAAWSQSSTDTDEADCD